MPGGEDQGGGGQGMGDGVHDLRWCRGEEIGD
jgi:hypothetical protein